MSQILSNQTFTDYEQALADAGAVGLIEDEPQQELRLYVVFAEGRGDRLPWELCDEADVGQVMVQAAETLGSGWTISVLDADVVPSEDMQRLAARLALIQEWDEFICLPEGVCSACGGTGYLEMDQCSPEGVCYTERGDCEGCDGSGRL
jgi:hypothetical protein